MKKYLSLIFVIISLSISASEWKPVEKMSTVSEQKVYLIISQYRDKSYYMKNDLYCNGVYGSEVDAYPPNDFNKYFTFQLKNAGDGYWNLYNVCRSAYVNATFYSPVSLIDEPAGVEPAKWTIDDKYIRCHLADGVDNVFVLRDRNYYTIMSESVINRATHAKPYDYLFPSIYELSTLTLDDDSDFPAYVDSFNVENVVFTRNFIDDVNNSLVLPFDVSNYKDVFGSEVMAYEFSHIEGHTINFTPVESNDLKANTPYIIKGPSFNPSPYTINTKTVYPVNSGKTNIGDIYIVYRSLKAKTGYVLTKTGLQRCHESNDKPLFIGPYRWYFSSDMSNAKINIINSNVSSIPKIKGEYKAKAVFDMQGRVVSDDSNNLESLPKGVYIIGGKKIIKK